MFELFDHQPVVDVPEAEYLRLLGFPPHHVLAGRARELADQHANGLRNMANRIYARQTEALTFTRTGLPSTVWNFLPSNCAINSPSPKLPMPCWSP